MSNSNLNAEERLLSIILNNPDKSLSAVSLLNHKCFTSIDTRNIYNAIYKIVDKCETADTINIIHQLRSDGILDTTIRNYIDNLVSKDENVEHFSSLVKEVIDLWKVRETNNMIEKMSQAIKDGTNYDNLKSIMNKYSHLDTSGYGDRPETMLSIIDKAIRETEEAIKNGKERELGLKFGFTIMDKVMSLRPGNTYCIAARPSMGKTSFALNIADNLLRQGKRIYYISTEMLKDEIMEKFITMKQAISNEDFRALPEENKLARYKELYSYHAAHNSELIIDSSSFQLYDTIARIRSLHKEKPLDLVIVDYLQQLELDDNTNRVQVVSEITRKYKLLASELKIPIIELSQLSRKVEDRAIKIPILSDLRDSGSIEQDMSGVIFIYRPSYYGIEEDSNGNDLTNIAEIIIAKNKFGRKGKIKYYFDAETTLFREVK